jgi:2,3-bisphosphoglycerate-dependent phosphoglycerate mutase
MARVDLYVKNSMWTVGEDWFLDSFFSTIAYQLEVEGWGMRFPALMKELYAGRLPAERTGAALEELATIRSELGRLEPQARVFDYDDPNKPTPWAVPPGAKTLAQCFLTASGDNLLDVLEEVLAAARGANADVEIRPFADAETHSYYVTGES